jgi:ribosomal protein S12 methylthiotransferase accessory factor
MLRREQRFFGLETPGMDLAGCDLHQRLLAAYAKVPH